MEKKSTFSPAMQFGLLTGLVLIVYTLILFLAGAPNKSFFLQIISYVLFIGMIFWGMFNIREHQLEGVMEYGKAFSIGFYISLFGALLFGIFMFFYLMYINPGILQPRLQEAIQRMQERNISQDKIDTYIKYGKLFGSLFASVFAFILNVAVGTILSLIIAIFAKREDKTIA